MSRAVQISQEFAAAKNIPPDATARTKLPLRCTVAGAWDTAGCVGLRFEILGTPKVLNLAVLLHSSVCQGVPSMRHILAAFLLFFSAIPAFVL